MTKLYLIGALNNPLVPALGKVLRSSYDVFDDWYAAGQNADHEWRAYEQARGRNYSDSLKGEAAQHVFTFDKDHLDAADAAILVMPAGKSAFLELGYMIGKGKKGYIYMPQEPDKWDVMFAFADAVVMDAKQLTEQLQKDFPPSPSTVEYIYVKGQNPPQYPQVMGSKGLR